MRIALILAVVGCSGGGGGVPDAAPEDAAIDAAIAPLLRNPIDLPDDALALQALQLLGANVEGANAESCNSCHGLTRQNLRYWRGLSDAAMASCLTDLAVGSPESARTMIDCARSMPAVPGSDYASKKLGIYSTATELPWFRFAFWRAYGADATTKLAELTQTAGMPKQGTPFTQPQFDIVAEWFARGLPLLEETLPQDPPPQTCDAAISADVTAHVATMKTTGWRAVNASNLMAMHGCGAATTPGGCLAGVPLGADQPYGGGWDLPGRGTLRVLADVEYASSYWTRSSPDGRFIAHGVKDVPGSYVLDLQRGAMRVPISAVYDPNWFPDNSGFVFQGGARNVCGQSVLTSNPASITMGEAACSNINTIGLYEHVGRALAGDFFAIDSEFVSDDGGHEPTLRDPNTSFGTQAYLSFVPMLWTGTKYQAKPQVTIKTPFEGDTVLSPSARLVISRVSGPGDRQLGFVLRKVNAMLAGTSYTITAPEVARYCVTGGKPGFSYDERWLVYHHYVTAADAVALGFTGPADPAFQPYLALGAANLYLMEIATGEIVRITNMQPGQYALFPHFRSDGWIYAAIRDRNTAHEYMVASDAALLAE
ncbi:MAG: hypothetical protein H0T89_34175 [Deltaproteobacteria bacterium]|nr:hypothetical protein [Deltaproteobacteria bacterium]MDQ3299820.1 hypothetical protein [Myxococcota bacterium]